MKKRIINIAIFTFCSVTWGAFFWVLLQGTALHRYLELLSTLDSHPRAADFEDSLLVVLTEPALHALLLAFFLGFLVGALIVIVGGQALERAVREFFRQDS